MRIDPTDSVFGATPVVRASDTTGVESSDSYFHTGGLSKREFFAALAMQTLVGRWNDMSQTHSKICSEQAVEYADALIVALNQRTLVDETAERLATK